MKGNVLSIYINFSRGKTMTILKFQINKHNIATVHNTDYP